MNTTGKRVYVTLFLFLFLNSCSSNSIWETYSVEPDYPPQRLAKICIPPQNKYRNLELEIVKGSYGSKMYVNVYSRELPEDPEHPNKTVVSILIDESTETTVYANRFKGGQRLLLPEDTAHKITEALRQNKPVLIRAGIYESVIDPLGFSEAYK